MVNWHLDQSNFCNQVLREVLPPQRQALILHLPASHQPAQEWGASAWRSLSEIKCQETRASLLFWLLLSSFWSGTGTFSKIEWTWNVLRVLPEHSFEQKCQLPGSERMTRYYKQNTLCTNITTNLRSRSRCYSDPPSLDHKWIKSIL